MISVIIPALNEEKALPSTLDQLLCQAGDFEVIVVDGGSTDRTREIARARSRLCLLTASKGRATQIQAAGFAHFTEADIAYFQAKVDEMWEKWLLPGVIPFKPA